MIWRYFHSLELVIHNFYNTIYNIKTYNAPYVTKMLFVGAVIVMILLILKSTLEIFYTTVV